MTKQLVYFSCLALLAACSSGGASTVSDRDAGVVRTGGVATNGGAASAGGSSTSAGGSASTGGSPTGSGGSVTSSGGAAGTGGSTGAAGNVVTGGAKATDGGVASGGVGTGGAASTGGVRASGGAVGSGGSRGADGGVGTGGRPGTDGGPGTGGSIGTGGGVGTGGGTGAGGSSAPNQPIGWASVNALGQNGTTGGLGGPTTTVTTCAALQSAASQSGAAIVKVSGTITCDNVAVSSNKSIIGLSGAAIISPSGSSNHLLVVNGVSNIIVRNLKLQGAGVSSGSKSAGDTFHVEASVHHLWADHLDISDGDDGNLDITHDCNYITVSWTKFHYTTSARVHRFSNLIASALGDTGTYKITWHHDWWADNVDQRSPRAHEGSGGIHIFNNYYSEAGNSYCVGVGGHAIFLSENNYFDGVNVPFYMSPNGETGGQILSKGDVFNSCTGNTTGTSTGFTPPYPYSLDPTANVPAVIKAGAGATM